MSEGEMMYILIVTCLQWTDAPTELLIFTPEVLPSLRTTACTLRFAGKKATKSRTGIFLFCEWRPWGCAIPENSRQHAPVVGVVTEASKKASGPCRHLSSTLPPQWFLASARLYAYQPLLQIAQILKFRRKRALWSALSAASENSIGVTDIRHMNNCRITEISIKLKQ
jgi:hypothetical protein